MKRVEWGTAGVKAVHPGMGILQEAQNAAYGGTGFEVTRQVCSAYTSSLAVPRPASFAMRDRRLRAGLSGPGAGAPPCAAHGRLRDLYAWRRLHEGDPNNSDPIAWGFCGQAVVSVDDRLKPKHPFPAAFGDCNGVLAWAAANPSELGVEPARIALVGGSAGGQLATGMCLAASDRGGPPIATQVPIQQAAEERAGLARALHEAADVARCSVATPMHSAIHAPSSS